MIDIMISRAELTVLRNEVMIVIYFGRDKWNDIFVISIIYMAQWCIQINEGCINSNMKLPERANMNAFYRDIPGAGPISWYIN